MLYQLKYKFSIQFSINVLAHSMIKTKKESYKSSTLSWKDKNNALGINYRIKNSKLELKTLYIMLNHGTQLINIHIYNDINRQNATA